MKLTNREVMDVAGGIREVVSYFLNSGDMNNATRYGFTARYLAPFREAIFDARNALVAKHSGGKDVIEHGSEGREAFLAEWLEYLGCEIEVDIEPISLPNMVGLDPDVFISILPVLKRE